MYRLRDAYVFDQDPCLPDRRGIRYWSVWMSEDRCTFYVEAGARSGYRLLVHYHAQAGYGPVPYAADSLHARTLVRVREPANVAEYLRHVFGEVTPGRLVSPAELGFTFDAQGIGHHPDGWYTQSIYAMPLGAGDTPDWADGSVTAHRLREGVLVQGDGWYRLVPTVEYFEMRDARPLHRQGDLGIWQTWPGGIPADVEVGVHHFDRHQVEITETQIVVEHPEHDTLRIDRPEFWSHIAFLPGSSRPFARADVGLD